MESSLFCLLFFALSACLFRHANVWVCLLIFSSFVYQLEWTCSGTKSALACSCNVYLTCIDSKKSECYWMYHFTGCNAWNDWRSFCDFKRNMHLPIHSFRAEFAWELMLGREGKGNGNGNLMPVGLMTQSSREKRKDEHPSVHMHNLSSLSLFSLSSFFFLFLSF